MGARNGLWLEWSRVWVRAATMSWTDAEFRAQLLADPAAALSRIDGYTLPPGVTLTVVESVDPPTDLPPHGDYDVGHFGHPHEKVHMTVPLLPVPDSLDDGIMDLTRYPVFSGGVGQPHTACVCMCS